MTQSPRTPFAGRPSTILIALVAIGIVCLLTEMLLSARQDSIEKAMLNITNDRNIAASNIELVTQQLRLSLESVEDGLRMTTSHDLSSEVRRAILFNKATRADPFGSILVLDAQGRLRYDSRNPSPQMMDLSDRDYFKVFRDGSSTETFVSAPLVSKLTGQKVIVISRRLSTPSGGFGGVVVGTLLADRLVGFLSQAQEQPGVAVSLYRDDGLRLLRTPGEVIVGGAAKEHSPLFQYLAKKPSGTFEARSPTQEERLFSYGRIGNLPLVIMTSMPRSVALADWYRYAQTMTAITLCLVAIALVISLLFQRELKRRVDAEKSLRALAGELDRQAHTDVLTGVGNRRTFEENFDTEWRRHLRQQASLAVIIVDVDLFKAYNDAFGHAAGDGALVTVARCLAASAQRAGDSVARLGGEEFVLLLPDTNAAGAQAVAERFRDMLARCSVSHPDSPVGRLTVSIGIAGLVPDTETSRAALLDAADKALYDAKSAGRDCVRLAGAADDSRSDVGCEIVALSA